MKNIRYIKFLFSVLIILVGLGQNARAQQIPLYSQYQFNQYLYNPAVAGSEAGVEARLVQRFQWVGIIDAPRTFNVNAYGPLDGQKMGVGGMVYSDITGPTRRTGFMGSFAYHLQLNDEMRLGFGLGIGFDQYVIDGTQVRLDQSDDPALQNYLGSSYEFNTKFGVYFYGENYYAGISIPQLVPDRIHIFDSATNSAKLEDHYIVNGGYTFTLGDNFAIEPALLMRWKTPVPVQFDISVWGYYREMIWLGITYRTEDALSFGVGFDYNDMLMIGYSYDYTLSSLSSYTSGSHEIMLGFKFNAKKNEEVPPLL
jgi:type IX secretion system PorP/SprF family membrane protein